MSASVTRPADATGSDRGPFGRRLLTPLLVGSALNPINTSLIATALVPIAQSLGISNGRTAILIAALYLASAVAQPTMGRLAEHFGPRRVFLAGAAVVVAGGALGAVGSGLEMLVVSRVLIGIGTAAAYPTAILVIRRGAGDSSPGSVLGLLSISSQVTVVLGLPLGGLLVGFAGWRSVFLINVPCAIAAFVMGLAWLPRDAPARRGGFRATARELDVPGIVLFAASMTGLMFFLMSLQRPRWEIGAATAVVMVVLVLRERRVAHPFFDVRALVANRPLTLTYLRTGAIMFGSYCVMYGVSQWLQEERDLDATTTGLVLLPSTAVAALVSGPVARRALVRLPLVVAAVGSVLVAGGLLFLGSGSPLVEIVAVTCVLGVTCGLAMIGNQAALYAQAKAEEAGTAAGLQRTATYLGAIVSSSTIGIVYADGVSDSALHHLGYALLAVAVATLALTLVDRRLPRRLS